MKMKMLGVSSVLGLLFLGVVGNAASEKAQWEDAVRNNLDFFNRYAWDEASGSYASEVGERGNLVSDVREIVPLSRLIYANSNAPEAYRDLRKARASADFVIRHMLATDEIGFWFRSAVGKDGTIPSAASRPYLFIFEEAYGISGLTALYSADPAHNADLLPIIRKAAKSFWGHFSDPKGGGLFYYYNVERRDHTNDHGETHKSYQSTIYPISSFLLALRNADTANRALYDGWINELLNIAISHIVEHGGRRITGWLYERFNKDFSVDETYTMSEAGHITQLAWVLGEAVKQGIVKDRDLAKVYQSTASTLLSKFLDNRGIAEKTGCNYDAFNRTTGEPLEDDKGRVTTAWWSDLEAIIVFTFAERNGWQNEIGEQRIETTLEGLKQCYFDRFVDRAHGSDYFRIESKTGAVIDFTKGNGGKSAYHATEAYWYLFRH